MARRAASSTRGTVLIPTREGHTRFLIRSTISNRQIPTWAAALNFTAFQLPHFIMQRQMMLTIKQLAEEAAATGPIAAGNARRTNSYAGRERTQTGPVE